MDIFAPPFALATIAQVIAGLSPQTLLTPSCLGQIGIPTEIFGGVPGTVAGDSANIRAALQSSAAIIDLKPRVYMLDAAALANVALTGKVLRGIKGQTVLRMSTAPTIDMFSSFNATNFALRGIRFDGAGYLTSTTAGAYPGFQPCALIEGASQFAVDDCDFTGFSTCGLLANVVSFARIGDGTATRASAASTENYGYLIVGGGSNVDVLRNVNRNCNIAVDINNSRLWANDVAGWGFSAGINVADDPSSCHDLLIALNGVHDSNTVPDYQGFYLDCIECWAPNSQLVINRLARSIGNGLSFGAPNTLVALNHCIDNGSVESGASAPAGWGIRALSGANGSGSESIVALNRAFDTRAAGSKMQRYGYGENTNALTGNQLWANNFDGNGTAPTQVFSPTTMVNGFRAPTLTIITATSATTTAAATTASAAGTGTYTPPPGCLYIRIRRMLGGGGAGAGSSNGTITAGGNGTATTFGPLTAAGGSGAPSATGGNGGAVPTTGDDNFGGGSGDDGFISPTLATSDYFPGGAGGASIVGGCRQDHRERRRRQRQGQQRQRRRRGRYRRRRQLGRRRRGWRGAREAHHHPGRELPLHRGRWRHGRRRRVGRFRRRQRRRRADPHRRVLLLIEAGAAPARDHRFGILPRPASAGRGFFAFGPAFPMIIRSNARRYWCAHASATALVYEVVMCQRIVRDTSCRHAHDGVPCSMLSTTGLDAPAYRPTISR